MKPMKLHIKKGSLHKMLGIPMSERIPPTMLEEILHTPSKTEYLNHYGIGKSRIYVTSKLHEKANFAINFSPQAKSKRKI